MHNLKPTISKKKSNHNDIGERGDFSNGKTPIQENKFAREHVPESGPHSHPIEVEVEIVLDCFAKQGCNYAKAFCYIGTLKPYTFSF